MAKKPDQTTDATPQEPAFKPRTKTIWQMASADVLEVSTSVHGRLDLVPKEGLTGDAAIADVIAQYGNLKHCEIVADGDRLVARAEGFPPSTVTVARPKK